MADTYFPDYDPTPYDGGFDLEQVYGKSHAPSEKSCYSPSHADQFDVTSLRDDDDDKLSVVSAYGVEIPNFDDDDAAIHATEKPNFQPSNESANDSQQRGLPKPEEGKSNSEGKRGLPKPEEGKSNSEGNWEPNYPVPEYRLRDSDLALCQRCGMPLYCNCGCQIFSFYTSEDRKEPCEKESLEDVADKVGRWLFSSSYI